MISTKNRQPHYKELSALSDRLFHHGSRTGPHHPSQLRTFQGTSTGSEHGRDKTYVNYVLHRFLGKATVYRARLALCLFLFKSKMAKFFFRIYIFSLKAEERERGVIEESSFICCFTTRMPTTAGDGPEGSQQPRTPCGSAT